MPLLDKLRPALTGARSVLFPGPVPEGMERPRITFHCLNSHAIEDAYLANVAHFRKCKTKVGPTDPIFIQRERAEQLWRAARDADGQPIAEDTDKLEEILAPELRAILWSEWAAVQAEYSAAPHTEAELRELVDALKKNFPVERFEGWPSTWLQQLLRISVGQSSS